MTNEQREAIEDVEEFNNKFDCGKYRKSIDTVLSLIKEQQEENKKKDKIIDYMIDWIRERSIYAVDSHDMLKQYFERRVKDES